MKKLTVTAYSRLSVDGFEISMIDEDKGPLFNKSYDYGNNASHSRDLAKYAHKDHVKFGHPDKPYVSDILQELIQKYQINEVSVEAGWNTFACEKVSDQFVEDFKTKFCDCLQVVPLLTESDLSAISTESEEAAL